MKRPDRRTIAIFAFTFLLTLLVSAPASLLSGAISAVSKGQFLLANTSGTVWRGSATPVIRQLSGGLVALERLNWNFELSELLTGKLVLQLRWDNVEQSKPMKVIASFTQIELRDVVVPLHAGLFAELVPLMKPIQLSGPIQIRSPKLVINKQGLDGAASAEWTNAASALSAVKPLGNYQINLTGSGRKLEVALRTVSGMLLLDGNGSFTPEQGVRFQGTARAAEDSKGSLNELLANFGPESAPGVHLLSLMR